MQRVIFSELDAETEAAVVEYHIEKSKKKGDWHWRQAEMISGGADYINGYDDGEMPKGV